jgi:hypothetical protein
MSAHDDADLGRRDLIKLGAVATVAASLGVTEALAGHQAAAPAQTFFTPAELAMVDELGEMIIPADEHAPGARAARVAAYIDRRLADAWDPQERIDWREGLQRINHLSQQSAGTTFMQASPAQRLAVLTRIARNEKDPRQPDDVFFGKLKSRIVDAYYTSEIGIKQELEYKGNSYLAEFAGEDVS